MRRAKNLPLREPRVDGVKRCPRCDVEWPISQFHIDRKRHDGRVQYCPDCIAANGKRWRQNNPEHKKAIDRAYHLSTVDEHRRRSKQWVADNPEKARETQRALYLAQRSARIAAASAWRKANPDRRKAQHVKDKAIRRTREVIGSFTGKEWKSLVAKFDGRCVCCGKTPAKLTADHVVPVSRGGTNYIANIQPLCAPCNSSKHNRHSTDYRDTPFTRTGHAAPAA
jgi:5-methylcytosine-specific restriction endonuclease McrA